MSSNPRARRWRLAGWSLRARLLATVVGLVAIVCVIVGVATEIAVYRFQVGQLDSRLAAANGRNAGGTEQTAGNYHDPFQGGPPQLPGTLNAHIWSSGYMDRADYLDDSNEEHHLDAAAMRTLARLPVDRRPYTRNLGSIGD